MIGGDLKAFTILGIDYNENADTVKYLVLDPHYTGSDSSTKDIIKKGFVGWKDVKHFQPGFYNLCLPI
jgi:hypothetical protein